MLYRGHIMLHLIPVISRSSIHQPIKSWNMERPRNHLHKVSADQFFYPVFFPQSLPNPSDNPYWRLHHPIQLVCIHSFLHRQNASTSLPIYPMSQRSPWKLGKLSQGPGAGKGFIPVHTWKWSGNGEVGRYRLLRWRRSLDWGYDDVRKSLMRKMKILKV